MNENKIKFIHANGFPPNAYESMIKSLDNNTNIDFFLLDEENFIIEKIKDWIPFHNSFVKSLDKKIIGIGHSIGGNIVLRSALTNPNKFSKIILLDPTLFIPRIIYGYIICSKFGLEKKVHPFLSATTKKKTVYKNHDSMFNSYREKKIFSKINDKNLKIYINSITNKNGNQIKINFSKEWEYHIYKTGLIADMFIWKNISKLTVPCLVIKAENSNAFLESSKYKMAKLNPNIIFHTIKDSTHLFPLEFPKETADSINNFIQSKQN